MRSVITKAKGDLLIKLEYQDWNVEYSPHAIFTSHNGYQWTGVNLRNWEEVVALRDALDEYIKQGEPQ